MKIAVVDQAIQACESHLAQSNAKGTEIEAYLTRYLLILMCSSFEETIEKFVVERAQKSKDTHLVSFVRSSVGHLFRSIKTSEISGLLNRFGDDYKLKFQNKTQGTLEETFYNNIVVNRHTTAHGTGSNLTFDELVAHYEKGHVVLDNIRDALD